MKFKNKVILSSLILISGSALAETSGSNQGTQAAKDAFANITLLANEFISMAWPLVTLLVGALIGIKLFKKFASRAS